MRTSLIPVLATAILAFAIKFAGSFFFPPIIPIFWSGCSLGWFIIPIVVCNQNGGSSGGGGGGAAPLTCRPDEYIFAGACKPRNSQCAINPQPPGNTVLVASSNRPCRCEAPGYLAPIGSGQTVCSNPPNGLTHCVTDTSGSNSFCDFTCNSGYIKSGTQCVMSSTSVLSCNGQRPGFGQPGQGCQCYPPAAGLTPPNQRCTPMILDPTTGLPNGERVCEVVNGHETCVTKCDNPSVAAIGNYCSP